MHSNKMIGQLKDELRFELKQVYLCDITKNNGDGTIQAKSITDNSMFDDIQAYNGSISNSEQVLVLQVGEFDCIGLLLKRAVN